MCVYIYIYVCIYIYIYVLMYRQVALEGFYTEEAKRFDADLGCSESDPDL